jgi:hypothetical protein
MISPQQQLPMRDAVMVHHSRAWQPYIEQDGYPRYKRVRQWYNRHKKYEHLIYCNPTTHKLLLGAIYECP